MTDTALHPRKSSGTAGAGQWTERSFKEGAVQLTGRRAAQASSNREVPESLRMAHFQDPNLTRQLEWAVDASLSNDGLADYHAENFSDKLPHLHYEESAHYFSEAQRARADGGDWRAVIAEAAAADTARHPGGTLAGDYVPPISHHQPGYQQGTLITGSKYTGYRDATEICKDIRTELKAATEANYLPAGLKYSVTNDKYSGGQSVNVTVQGVTDEDRTLGSTDLNRHGEIADLPEVDELKSRVEAITNAYNRMDVDGQADYAHVAYWGRAEIETDRGREFRESEAAKRRAARTK
ncbi:MAG TPA: hypothetical protein VF885_05810 [Arthrobacter sp.]